MRLYLRALSYFRQETAAIVASLFLILGQTFASNLQPLLLTILIDTVLSSGGTGGARWFQRWFIAVAPTGQLARIETLAIATVVLRVVYEIFGFFQRILNTHIGYSGLVRVRCDLFRKLQELSIGYHRAQPQGDAIYRLSYDTIGFQTVLNVIVNTVLVSLMTLIVIAAIMFSINWQLTLVTLAVAPLLVGVTRLFAGKLRTMSMAAKEVESELTTAIQRSVSAVGLVQAYGRESDEFDHFSATVGKSVKASIRVTWVEMTYWMLVGTLFGLGAGVLFGYGGYLVYRDQFVRHLGEAGLTVGTLYPFLYYVHQLYSPIQSLTGSTSSLQSGIASVLRVIDVLDREASIKDSPGAIHLPQQPRVLELADVGFEYRPGEPVLQGISTSIRPGETVAFVGSSGVGKTTLLNLLPRFFDPTRGALKLDGHDLRQIRVKDLRRHIALVLQENVILPTTVAENIAYGRPRATEAQIRHAAELAGAAEFIDRLPDKYDTPVSESGSNLSGGQRQRIGIARALLTEAPILVLDEPTSALDARHEAMIIATLARLKRQRTIILVSHRLSTVMDCDRIYVMRDGRIVEQGTHGELLELRGVYFDMARHQLGVTAEGNQPGEPARSA